jgi:hypothetical protein
MKEVTLRSLEKANKILENVKELDRLIIQLERLAMILSNKKSSVKITLTVDDLEKEIKEPVIDEDGSMIIRGTDNLLKYLREQHERMMFRTVYGSCSTPPIIKHDESLTQTITDTAGLGILGVLLGEYQSQRTQYLNQLQKLGFKI